MGNGTERAPPFSGTMLRLPLLRTPHGRELGRWLKVGVGVASGEEFVGNVGSGGYKDFTALGDVTNTAARLNAQAGAEEILIDAETYAEVSAVLTSAVREELSLKGKQAPVAAYRLTV